MKTIHTNGADIFITERPNGGWTVQQGTSRLLVTPNDVRQLMNAFKELLAPLTGHGGESVAVTKKPPMMRYIGTTSRQILDYVNSRPATVAHDLMSAFGLTHDAATKHLQRLHEAALVRRPQHGVYAPLISPVADLYSSDE